MRFPRLRVGLVFPRLRVGLVLAEIGMSDADAISLSRCCCKLALWTVLLGNQTECEHENPLCIRLYVKQTTLDVTLFLLTHAYHGVNGMNQLKTIAIYSKK